MEVPLQQLKAIYALPESKVSIRWAQSETIQAKYTAADPEIFKINFHVNVIRNQITSSLDYLTGASLNSWQLALKNIGGWKIRTGGAFLPGQAAFESLLDRLIEYSSGFPNVSIIYGASLKAIT